PNLLIERGQTVQINRATSVTNALNGGLQVIITDHPYFDDDQRFKDAVVERWIDGRKLVPEEWPAT
ncbi:hypothetical protein, partial [Limnobacter sp.]|uniref:hypothetical protein n=1 Tax=Limnobacter sp. TaxID=2003368 RepID=UPI002FE40FF5